MFADVRSLQSIMREEKAMKALSPDDPQEIGAYRIIAVLGRGGMGTVYLGVDRSTGAATAIKVMLPGIASDHKLVARFVQEVEATRRIVGEHVAKIVYYDLTGERPYYASEYIVGVNLAEIVQLRQNVSVEEILDYASGICRALQEIHSANVIHRDIKPANIIVDGNGRVWIVDFGIASIAGQPRITLTNEGIIGSACFIAPEYIESPKRLTPACDVFSLGVTIAFLAGCAPFGNHDKPILMLQAIRFNEPDLSGLPLELKGIVAGCLVKDPAQRIRLEQLAAMLPSRASSVQLDPTMKATIVERTRLIGAPPSTRPFGTQGFVAPDSLGHNSGYSGTPRPPAPPYVPRRPRLPLGLRLKKMVQQLLVAAAIFALLIVGVNIYEASDSASPEVSPSSTKASPSSIVTSSARSSPSPSSSPSSSKSLSAAFFEKAKELVGQISDANFSEDLSGQATYSGGLKLSVDSLSVSDYDLVLDVTAEGDDDDDINTIISLACISLPFIQDSDSTKLVAFYGDYTATNESTQGKSSGKLRFSNVLLLPGELQLRIGYCSSSTVPDSNTAATLGTSKVTGYENSISVSSHNELPVDRVKVIDDTLYVVTPSTSDVWIYAKNSGVVEGATENMVYMHNGIWFSISSFAKTSDDLRVCAYTGSSKPSSPTCNSDTELTIS